MAPWMTMSSSPHTRRGRVQRLRSRHERRQPQGVCTCSMGTLVVSAFDRSLTPCYLSIAADIKQICAIATLREIQQPNVKADLPAVVRTAQVGDPASHPERPSHHAFANRWCAHCHETTPCRAQSSVIKACCPNVAGTRYPALHHYSNAGLSGAMC